MLIFSLGMVCLHTQMSLYLSIQTMSCVFVVVLLLLLDFLACVCLSITKRLHTLTHEYHCIIVPYSRNVSKLTLRKACMQRDAGSVWATYFFMLT